MLDTCGLLSLAGIAQKTLSNPCLAQVRSANQVYISACSLFEITLKHKREKLDLAQFKTAEHFWDTCLSRYQLTELPVTAKDFAEAVNLPDHHADPFDRIIIAQSQRLRCPIVTYDTQFTQYGVKTIE